MIDLKTTQEIDAVRRGGAILSAVLTELVDMVRPGLTTGEVDAHAERRIREQGGVPSFKGYKTSGDPRAFPSTVCTSIDNEVVHGPAAPSRTLKEGSLFKMDIGMWYEGLCTDMAVTVPVGSVSKDDLRLMRATKESLMIGLGKAIEGGWISDIGKAVDKFVRRKGYTTVKDLVGHGVGRKVHEDPRIPNYYDPGLEPVRIVRGMVLAIEPMVNAGAEDVRILPDGWTIVSADGSRSAHFEVTLAITENGTEIMTPVPENA